MNVYTEIEKARELVAAKRLSLEDFEALLIGLFYRKPEKLEYDEYIQSPAWKRRADAAKERAGYRCQVCNRHKSTVILDAHHRTYERLGRERDEDITVLCRECHEMYETDKRMRR